MTDGDELAIDQRLFPFLERIAPGVIGYTIEQEDGSLWIPLIQAEEPGRGDVAKYLDALPRDRRVVIPTVVNDILRQMLVRRGFDEETWMQTIDGESVQVTAWIREPKK